MDIFEKLVEAKTTGKALVLATVIDVKGSAPREVGAKMILWQDGSIDGTIGGGAIEKVVLEEAAKLFSTGQAKIFEYDLTDLKMQCGGNMTLFLEPILPKSHLVVFGAGHIGLALAKMADLLNFRLTVVDDRPEFAASERFPQAQQILAKAYKEAFSEIQFTGESFVVIATYKHLHDQDILEFCATQPFAYLGMIGSKTKVVHSLNKLKEQGIDPEIIKRIHTPIGLNIGANTPEEIAVAIMAEIIAIRNGADVGALNMKLAYA